ncbi:MAG: cysteine desulfurase [Candidatus Dadabacteria bacterium]|nr:MAG: cysteine desulfurase [Candidatus Dadabacteria bacterium]
MIYLDNNASTPLDPRVADYMYAVSKQFFGNPSSHSHKYGWEAEEIINIARESTAAMLDVNPKEVIFTSCATESINTVLRRVSRKGRKAIITTPIEHKAVLDTVSDLAQQGCEIRQVRVDERGSIDLNMLEEKLKKPALLVSVIAANNEIGTIQPIKEIKSLCAKYDTLLHLDITQWIGKATINLKDVHFASFSAHKYYGPKGVGGLYISSDAVKYIRPLITGGGQENGLRSGTLNTVGIAGIGKASEIISTELHDIIEHVTELSEIMWEKLSGGLGEISLNGHPTSRIPGNINISIGRASADKILSKLASKVALSSSSACSSEHGALSHVLRGIGLPEDKVRSSIRIGIGRFNTREEINQAADLIIETARNIR